MKRFYSILFAIGLIFAGCADSSDDGTMDSEAMDDGTSSNVAMLRPDPLNPVNEELTVPLGWKYRFDDAAAEISVGADADSFDVFFVSMTPGWHVTTTHGSGIFWHPASTAEGSFTASMGVHLFAPGQRNEGFGLILGGENLDQADQSYVYFLIRRSGEFLIKQRTGDETETLFGWEANDAIHPYTDESEATVFNTLSVRVDNENVAFLVNDMEVHAMPKGDLQLDGIVGLRMNHGLNMHIEHFGVEQTM